MKLHKTRDGETKTRAIEGVIRVGRHTFRVADDPVSLRFTDERGASWALTMTDEEARDLGHALLDAYVPGPCKRCGGSGIERVGDPPVEPDWCAECGGAGVE